MAFADYLQQAVLTPLGMSSASFEPGPARSELMSKAYRKGEPADELPLRDVPAGGLNASVLDLSRFLAMVFADGKAGARQVLRAESVAEMLRPQNTDVALDFNFRNGLGWMLSTLGGATIENAGPVAHHAGGTPNFRAQMYALPAHRLGVVVMANSGSAGAVVDRVATETLALALQAKTGIKQPQRTRVPAADPPWPEEKLQAYVGDYTTLVGHVRIRLEGQRLRAEALGRSFNLVPRSDGRIGVEYALLGLLRIDLGATLGEIGFARATVAGREMLVGSVGPQQMLIGEHIQPPAESDLGRWRQRVGSYEIVDAGRDHVFLERAALIEEDGFLFAELTMADQGGPALRVLLKPVSDSEALLLGSLADGGETLRCEADGDGERCTCSGYALKKVAPLK